MLNEILYDILMKMTNFLKGIWILEDCIDMKRNIFGRALLMLGNVVNKILTVCFWLGWYSVMISMTGGLYLVWIGFKLIRRNRKRRRGIQNKRKRA